MPSLFAAPPTTTATTPATRRRTPTREGADHVLDRRDDVAATLGQDSVDDVGDLVGEPLARAREDFLTKQHLGKLVLVPRENR